MRSLFALEAETEEEAVEAAYEQIVGTSESAVSLDPGEGWDVVEAVEEDAP